MPTLPFIVYEKGVEFFNIAKGQDFNAKSCPFKYVLSWRSLH